MHKAAYAPILALTPETSEMARLLREHNLPTYCAPPNDAQAIAGALRAFGVPSVEFLPEGSSGPHEWPLRTRMADFEAARINPTGELPEPLPAPDAAIALANLDGYTENQTDKADLKRQWPQLKGQFLIDRDGIVRWANIECGTEGLAGLGKFPSRDEILTAARSLAG